MRKGNRGETCVLTNGPREAEPTSLEKESLEPARRLSRDNVRKLIAQARALAEFKK